jgi:hypothetical protein
MSNTKRYVAALISAFQEGRHIGLPLQCYEGIIDTNCKADWST